MTLFFKSVLIENVSIISSYPYKKLDTVSQDLISIESRPLACLTVLFCYVKTKYAFLWTKKRVRSFHSSWNDPCNSHSRAAIQNKRMTETQLKFIPFLWWLWSHKVLQSSLKIIYYMVFPFLHSQSEPHNICENHRLQSRTRDDPTAVCVLRFIFSRLSEAELNVGNHGMFLSLHLTKM